MDTDTIKEQLPTRHDIEVRAYQLYLQHGCEDGHADENWFTAEKELTDQRGRQSLLDDAIADEELSQVRASERLKKERENAEPRTKPVSVGQQR